jgi:hypothetical protein
MVIQVSSFSVDLSFEKKMQSYIDGIYYSLFPSLKEIIRSNRDDFSGGVPSKWSILDKDLSIDSILLFKNGTMLTLQEKIRRSKFLRYDDFTFEYYSNRVSKTGGQWFKLCSQLFFYGFSNETENSIDNWYILNIPNLRIYLSSFDVNSLESCIINNPHRNSCFIPFSFKELPMDCILYSSDLVNKLGDGK